MSTSRWLILVLPVAIGCGGEPEPGPGPDPLVSEPGPTLDEQIAGFRGLAADAGWTVQDGRYEFLDHNDCCEPGFNCLWNNPSTPYGLYALPPGPDQTGTDTMLTDDGLARSYHLREDEVLVLLGRTPPPAKYFSYRSYISWKVGNPGLQFVIGSLGESLNHQVIAAKAVDGNPFDRPVAIVTSSDAAIERQIDELLIASGFDASEVFEDRVVHDKVAFGLGDDADQLMAVSRTAVVEDPGLEEAYYAEPGLTLLRLTPEVPIEVTEPHLEPVLLDRGTGLTEAAWTGALNALGDAIHERYASFDFAEQTAEHFWFETLDCIDEGHCSGDIRDRYYAKVPALTIPDEEVFAVAFGVNHERTGKASYSNMSVDTILSAIGLEAMDSRQMVGTAAYYLPDHPQTDDLFAVVIARNCADRPEPHCIDLPYECPGVATNEALTISFRSYLEPATGAAPTEGEQLAEHVIRFGLLDGSGTGTP